MTSHDSDDQALQRLEEALERANKLVAASSPGEIQYELAARLCDQLREEIALSHAKAKALNDRERPGLN
jgi:hypothetical protein